MTSYSRGGCCHATLNYVICCTATRKSTRIKVLWGWLLVLATACSVFMGCVLYQPYVQYASPSDMRAVTNNVRYLFCDVVSVESPGPTFDAYRVQGHLELSDFREVLEENTALYIGNGRFDYFSFYFLAGSELTILHCSKKPMAFYVFKGEDNFNEWKDDRVCEDCFLLRDYLEMRDNCNTLTQRAHVIVPEEGQYFVVYSSVEGSQAWVTLQMTLQRTVYNLSDAYVACSDVISCNVVLDKNTQTVVFQVNSYYDLGMYRHPQITTSCVPRIWSYCIIYGFGVLIFGIIGSILIQKLCRSPRDGNVRSNNQDDRAPLLSGRDPPPSYSSIVDVPPKYEDVMRYAEIDPPSYQEVLTFLQNMEPAMEQNTLMTVTAGSTERCDVTCVNTGEVTTRLPIDGWREGLQGSEHSQRQCCNCVRCSSADTATSRSQCCGDRCMCVNVNEVVSNNSPSYNESQNGSPDYTPGSVLCYQSGANCPLDIQFSNDTSSS